VAIPNAGKINTYTSGCPKNQKRCWYKRGLPPPLGSKNVEFNCRSNNNKVIPAAKTGNERSKRKLEIIRLHRKTDICSKLIFFLVLAIVTIKLIDATTEDVPAVWSEKILKSTLELGWPQLLKGG
jgi:hypothetical protein